MWILIGIITSFVESISYILWKKSMSFYNWDNMNFMLFGSLTVIPFIIIMLLVFWTTQWLLSSSFFMIGVFFVALTSVWNNLLEVYVTKNEKLSALLPYGNLDKIFVIIIGFILFGLLWQETSSYVTFFIALFLVIASTIFSLYSNKSWWKISFSKNISLFILYKFNKSLRILFAAYLLIEFSSIDYFTIYGLYTIVLVVAMVFFSWRWFTNIISQTKQFYAYRIGGSMLSDIWAIGWLLIIESLGVVVATLIWFLWMVFQIISMKLILKDSPSKEQISFAFFVLVMISIGYYFK